MKWTWVSHLGFIALYLSLPAYSQTTEMPSSCPLALSDYNPSGVRVHVQNTSGKTIVGITFNAALSDATEHWGWLHWGFGNTWQLREFGWNKTLKPGAVKTLSWDRAFLDFRHGGGSAFVLTSVLFEDGSNWEEPVDSASCKIVRYNSHKKGFVKPIQLPPREP
jgi:hypothetical protein